MKAIWRANAFGFTLAEVVISTAIAGLTIGGIVYGYIFAARQAEWTGYSLAAQSLAIQRIEQTRAAVWNPYVYPVVDFLQTSNFPARIEVLDIPRSGTNLVYATNVTTIANVSLAPPLRLVRVDCSWKFMDHGSFTNTIITYRSP